MKIKNTLVSVVVIAGSLISLNSAFAGDLEWSGLYRAEGLTLLGPDLDGGRKEYGVHTLILRPKIVAADGLYINAQLNVFNSSMKDGANQLGAYFGTGLGDPTVTPTDATNSNSLSENEKSESFRVSQFYLTHVQEYGSLIVGRAPVEFGLGISHNAGRGLFDHFADTRDLVGYKIMMGNFFFLPMYAKLDEGGLSNHDDVNEWNFQLQYENPEGDSAMGVFYQNRDASRPGNDYPSTLGGVNGEYNSKNFNIFFKKETENYSAGIEVAQQGGTAGAQVNGKNVSLSGFGIAAEFEWHKPEAKTAYGLKAGYATGDNPSTEDEYEGFIFDRNYDVALFLFNHALGQVDVLHTRALGRKDVATGASKSLASVYSEPDVEAISNAMYVSPYFKYKWSDRWSMVGALTAGWLDVDKVDLSTTPPTASVSSTGHDLGYELDLSLVFNVSEKVTWVNQFGYFEPGTAWEVDGQYSSSSMYGFITKAAVSF